MDYARPQAGCAFPWPTACVLGKVLKIELAMATPSFFVRMPPYESKLSTAASAQKKMRDSLSKSLIFKTL